MITFENTLCMIPAILEKTAEYLRTRPDVIGYRFGLTLGILILFLSFLFGLRQEYIGLAMFLGSFVYLIFRRKLIENNIVGKPTVIAKDENIERFFIKLSLVIYLIIFTISIVLLRTTLYYRPLSYFLLIIFLSTVVAFQIVILKEKKYTLLILVEIFLLSINIRSGIYYLYSPIYGYDIDYFINLANIIIEQGNIPKISVNSYHNLAIMPLTLVSIKILTGLSDKNAYFIIGIIELLSSLFIFLIAKQVFNFKVALLATLILNISDYFILYGFWIIAMSMGVFFICMSLFLITKTTSVSGNKLILNKSMLLLVLLVIILTHSITTIIQLIILIAIIISTQIYSILYNNIDKNYCQNKISFYLVVLFFVSFISYWMLVISDSQMSFFSRIITSIAKALVDSEFGNPYHVTSIVEVSFFSALLSKMGFLLIIIFTVFGLLLSLTCKNRTLNRFNLFFIFFILLAGIYIPSLMGIGFLLPARWFVFLYLIICIFAAYGILQMINYSKCSKFNIIVMTSLFSLLIFFMITSPLINSDNVFYSKELTKRQSLYDSEIAAGDFIEKVNTTPISKNSMYLLNINRSIILNPDDPESYLNKTILIRKYDFEKGFHLPFMRGSFGDFKRLTPELDGFLSGTRSIIVYNNAEAKVYLDRKMF